MSDKQLPLVAPYEIEEPEVAPLRLYPYQVEGRDYLRANKGALLADDMGVGKTVQAATAIQGEPVLIVCPPSVVGVWERELKLWSPGYEVVTCDKLRAFPNPHQAFILPSSRIPRHPRITEQREAKKAGEKPKTNEWKPYNYRRGSEPKGPIVWEGMHANTTIIVDEIHLFKNPKADRTIDLEVLMASGPARRWGLDGTPILSYATDLWQILKLLRLEKKAYPGGKREFYELYGGELEKVGWNAAKREPRMAIVWKSPPAKYQRAREEAIARVSLRRMKEQVAPWLPKKRKEFIQIDLSQEMSEELSAYSGEEWMESVESIERVMQSPSSVEFKTLSTMRALLATQKLEAALEIVEQFEDSREPLVVFTSHRAVVEKIGRRRGWARIAGGTPLEARTHICEEFQAGHLKGIVATIATAGVGITLTAGANVLFVDRDWTPEINRQAEDRCYRIGQTKPVRVMILVTRHPVDLRVEEVLTKKESLVRATFINMETK